MKLFYLLKGFLGNNMRKKIILAIEVISILVKFSSLTIAQVYNVSNANEIKNIQNSLMPGDTIVMQNGIWENQEIELTATGAENDSIVVISQTPGYVVLTGNSTFNISGKYLKIDGLRFVSGATNGSEVIGFRVGSKKAYHSRITNCSIIDYNPVNKNTGYKWVSIYGTNNRVDHCFLKGKTNDGATVVVWMPDSGERVYHRIDHNYFGERPPLGSNGGETIRIGTSDFSMFDASCVVEDNYFEHCNGEIEIISNKTGDNLIQRNTFYECKGTLTLRHGNGSTIRNNFFFGNNIDSTGGIRIIGERHKVYNNYLEGLNGTGFYSALSIMNGVPNSPLNRYFQVKNAIVAFNTIINCKSSFVVGLGSDNERTLPPDSCTVANNLIYNPNNQLLFLIDTPSNFLWEGNIFWGNDNDVDTISGITVVDPDLSNTSDGLFRIDVGSPAYNSAQGIFDFINNDIDGQPRDSLKDIGADEVSNLPILSKPLSSDDVGPDWLKTNIPYWMGIKTSGRGQVVLNPSGSVYDPGTAVTLEAIPDEGSTFNNWSGDTVSTENPITIIMNGNKNIIANFNDPNFYKLAYWITGSGTVSIQPNKNEYIEGDKVIISALPDTGWAFKEWGIDLGGNQNPDTLIMNSNKTISVKFEMITDINDFNITPILRLNQNYPNPFNPSTIINFDIDKHRNVTLTIYNSLGELIENIFSGSLEQGHYSFTWSGKNYNSGIYFARLSTGDKNFTIKILLIK